MTNDEAIKHIQDLICENNSIKPNMVVFELEKEALRIAIEALKERKTGQWIADQLCKHKPYRIRNTDRWTIYHCSCCDHSNGRNFNDKYCRNCGAKMEQP